MCATGWCEFWYYGDDVPFESIDDLVDQLENEFVAATKIGNEGFCVELPRDYVVRGDYWLPMDGESELRIAIGSLEAGDRKIAMLPLIVWLTRFKGVDVEDHMERESLTGFRVQSGEIDEYVWATQTGARTYVLQNDGRDLKLKRGEVLAVSEPGVRERTLSCGGQNWRVSEVI